MTLIDDFRQAWKGLRATPAFLALASGVLALGLGATIFMYGVINATLIEQPDYEQPERLVWIYNAEPARNEIEGSFSYLDYLEIRERHRTLSGLAAFYNGTVTVSGDGLPERYEGSFVTWNLFRVLGVRPMLGRDFTESDDAPNAAPVAILAHELWRARYGADPGILGRVVRINGRPTTIVGVMPPGFHFPRVEHLYVPIARDPATEQRGSSTLIDVELIGRMRDGVTREQVSADLQAVTAQLAKEYPETNAGRVAYVADVPAAVVGIEAVRMFWVMLGAVSLVLLIACANVASLIFVRASFRMYEASVRVALGARRARLVQQMLAESVIVAALGMLGGLALAAIALHAIDRAVMQLDAAPDWSFDIDLRVSLFALGAALLSGILAGIVPALRASRPDVMRILRDGGRTGTGLRLSRFTATMVVVEIALSAALLTGAGLMTKWVLEAVHRDLGVQVEGFMAGRVGLPEASYGDPERQVRFFERALEGLAAQPNVAAAAAVSALPGVGTSWTTLAVEGRVYDRRTDYARAFDVRALPGYFDTFGLAPVAGRLFDARDRADGLPVVVVDQTFAREHFPGVDPIGRRVRIAPEQADSPWRTIVGVVPDVAHDDLFVPRYGTVYTPHAQNPVRFMWLVAKPRAGEPHALAQVLRETVRRVDGDIPVYFLGTIPETIERNTAGLQLLSTMFAAFAVVAIVLAGVGIYGVLAFATGQRSREIGIRRALGARDRQILRTIMRSAALQLVAGLGLGALLAPLMARAVSSGFAAGTVDDPLVYLLTLGVLIAATLLASWIPALRALRVQPATALRHE